MRVKVISEIQSARGIIPVGQIIEISLALLNKLKGKVEELSSPVSDWRPEPKAWPTENGELRTQGVFDDLGAEIIKLTAGNLPLQAKLLRLHAGDYSGPAWGALVERWQEQAAIMQFGGGTSREDAEYQAAALYRAEAFLDELRATTTKGEKHDETST
jgi:hypothetical protein